MEYYINEETNQKVVNNLKIAKFMGYQKDYYDHNMNGKSEIWIRPDKSWRYVSPYEFDYDENLNSLMEVVDKMKNDFIEDGFEFRIFISPDGLYRTVINLSAYMTLKDADNVLDSLYAAILDIIENLLNLK